MKSARWFADYALPGLLGSTFITLGSLGVGWFPLQTSLLRIPLLVSAQTQTVGLALTRSFVVVGAALLLQAWLILGADLLHDRNVDIGTLWRVLIAWVLPLTLAVPLFSRDVYSYYMQGRIQLAGYNPYSTGVAVVPGWFTSGADPMWADAKSPYGPAFLLIEKAIAWLRPTSPMQAALVFRLICIGGVALLAWCIPRLARFHGVDESAAFWVGVMNPLVLMHFIAGAHNDAVMMGLIALAILLGTRRYRWQAAVCVGLALGIKPVAIVAVPFIGYLTSASTSTAVRARSVALVATVVGSVVILLSSAAQVGPLGWLNALATPGSVRSWLSPMTGLGIGWGNFMQTLGFAHFQDTAISITRTSGSVILGIVLMWLTLRPGGRSAARAVGLSMMALVLLGPVVQPWYLLWSIPLLAVTGLGYHQLRLMIAVIALFAIHAIANSSATADTFLEFSDGLAVLLAAATLGLALAASQRERSLLIGDRAEHDLQPATDEQRHASVLATLR